MRLKHEELARQKKSNGTDACDEDEDEDEFEFGTDEFGVVHRQTGETNEWFQRYYVKNYQRLKYQRKLMKCHMKKERNWNNRYWVNQWQLIIIHGHLKPL